MAYTPYARKIESLCPVAVRMSQTKVHAPAHETWGVVTCDLCGEKFFIGRDRIGGSRITAQECAKRVDTLLAEDHRRDGMHADSYEIAD